MLTEICKEVKNYFCDRKDRRYGTFKIEGGSIEPLSFLKEGQYFTIWGSTFNDGVYQYPTSELTDETFTGSIWPMNIPPAFLTLVDEIKAYNDQDNASPFTSESFGGYSYTKATSENGCPVTWKQVFSDKLGDYRRKRV